MNGGYMKKRLTIGTIGRMIGLSPQLLRNYGKADIIIPFRDEDSNYRYYSILQMVHLMKARHLKSMGFSLSEVLEQTGKYELYPDKHEVSKKPHSQKLSLSKDEWILRLKKRENEIIDEIAKLERIQCKAQEYRKEIDGIYDQYNEYTIESSPNWLFLELSNEEDEMSSKNEDLEESRKWTKLFPFTRYAFMCNRHDLDGSVQSNGIRRGLCILDQDAKRYHVKISRRTQGFKSQKCIHTIVGQASRLHATAQLMKNAAEYANAHDLKITGDAIAIYIASIHEPKCTMKFYDMWIPIA